MYEVSVSALFAAAAAAAAVRYGESEGYPERVMLIYDGLHYDAMAVAAFEGAPEELDITVAQVRDVMLVREAMLVISSCCCVHGSGSVCGGAKGAGSHSGAGLIRVTCVHVCRVSLVTCLHYW
jgi:hypothetical protein